MSRWPVDGLAKSAIRQASESVRLCGTVPAPVDKPVDIWGRTEFALEDQGFAKVHRKAAAIVNERDLTRRGAAFRLTVPLEPPLAALSILLGCLL